MMIKTATFALVHFAVAFAVAYIISGSFLLGGAIALIEPAFNTLAYHLHERVWTRTGQTGAARPLVPST